jgi:hypothetical protein
MIPSDGRKCGVFRGRIELAKTVDYRRERVQNTPSDAGRLVLLWLRTLLPASCERASHFPANAFFKGSREQAELEQRITELGGTVHNFWKED